MNTEIPIPASADKRFEVYVSKANRVLTLMILACVLAATLAGCSGSPPAGDVPAATSKQLPVVVSIAPLADFVQQVGGARVEVTTLVPAGTSPHTYVLSPSKVVAVSDARLLVLNGIGLEYWADKVIAAANNPDLVVVNTSQGIPVLAGDADEPGGNPHVWLNPQYAIRQVERIRDGLIQADPAGRATYESRAATYIATLQALDAEIAQQVASWPSKEFVAFHPSFAYFAKRYGLVQAAVIETTPGREPSSAELAEIIATVRRVQARAIFAEPQLSAKVAKTVAEESHTQLLYLDPLGSTIASGRYVDLLRYNVAQLAKALQANAQPP
ncbi:MAG: zinc ABC transporter substrate-binding protein [Chloroflexi bacterium]|nr:zinc ABC transporter substrate-binding protein [Chloroflexota bacterium]